MSKWSPSWCHLCRSWFNYLHIEELPIWSYHPSRIGTLSRCFNRWLNWGLSRCRHWCWLDRRCRCGWLRWGCLCLSNWKANLINLTEFILTLKYCSIYSYSYIYIYLKYVLPIKTVSLAPDTTFKVSLSWTNSTTAKKRCMHDYQPDLLLESLLVLRLVKMSLPSGKHYCDG